MTIKQNLIKRIDDRSAVIGVVGMGYVGLPLAVAFAQAGFKVLGVDVDTRKVDSLNRGESYIEDIPTAELAPLVESGHLRGSADYADLADVDAISICVPTPLRKTKDPDISYIVNATENIVKAGGTGKLIVLESTTYPGTTEEIILPRLEETGIKVGEDFFLAFSPERIDPGRTDYTMFTTPKVIGGVTPDCLDVSVKLYGTVVESPVPVSSTQAAEMVKLLENTFRAVNIGLVNEVALMCDKLGINAWEVIEGAATKPYGFMKFTPGPGLGGHCIPIDPHYLNWKLKTLNYTARFIELADEINRSMPEHVVSKVADALNDKAKAVKGSKILIIGVAYKPNISDVRESPALDVIHLLQEKGADVSYVDPFVATLAHEGLDLQASELNNSLLKSADCVVIITNHKLYDYEMIVRESTLLIDTRNATPQPTAAHVVLL